MRSLIVLLAAASLLPFHVGRAQAPIVLAPNTKVRFTLPPAQPPTVAEVLVQRGDSVWVRPLKTADTVNFTFPMLARLEVPAGRERHPLAGAVVGLVVGAVVGAAAGQDAGNDCSEPGPYPDIHMCLFPKNETALMGAVYIGALGAGVGALIGWLHETDRWRPVALPNQESIRAWRGGAGRDYGIGVTYRIF